MEKAKDQKNINCEMFQIVNDHVEKEEQKKLDRNSCILSFTAGVGCAIIITCLDVMIQLFN